MDTREINVFHTVIKLGVEASSCVAEVCKAMGLILQVGLGLILRRSVSMINYK